MSPGAQRFVIWVSVALAAIAVLTLSYAGTSWYLNRPTAEPVVVHEAPAPATTQPPADIVVHATGDVLLDTDATDTWTGVRDIFRSDALTIVNLECAAGAGGVKQDKEFTFRCDDPGALRAMRDAGVDVANQANNHSGDFGPAAQMDGRTRLIAAGLHPVGTGHNVAEANAPATFTSGARRVAVLGLGGVIPSGSWLATASRPGEANGYAVAAMTRAVRAAKANADLVFVAIHWGEELDTQPKPDDVARAHAMIDAGADAIFGHHAHRLQPLQWYKGRPIFFGLGNFVWPKGGATAIAEVIVPVGGPMRACLLPAKILGGRPRLTGQQSC